MNKTKSMLKLVMIMLIISYITLYTAKNTNLIEVTNRRQIELTNKEIEDFETKLDRGEKLDLDKYISDKKDYTNFFSKLGFKFSNLCTYIINDGLKNVFTFISKFFS